ncbi:hypothetical protein PROFUN_07396 [Planoprotostelium fungivorum]|uniref:Uncharacterized protein n=1 Tax=Planoprotostelium fungivorum TaxID=1890364 RepID=A0A2P6MTH1_9EUKA|nr:hypothetical protein PROFUN_07396 [Planoprotostelium fungivorum]
MPLCFIEIVLCGLNDTALIILGLRRIHQLYKEQNKELAKWILLSLMSFLYCLEVITHVMNHSSYLYITLSNAVQSLTTVCIPQSHSFIFSQFICLTLTIFEYSRGYSNIWFSRLWMVINFTFQSVAFQSMLELYRQGEKTRMEVLIQFPSLSAAAIIAVMATFLDGGPAGYKSLNSEDSQTDDALIGDQIDAVTNSSWPSRFVFQWIWPLMRTGFVRPLQLRDMFALPSDFKSNVATERLEEEWERQLTKDKPSLWFAVARAFKRDIIRSCYLRFLTDALSFVPAAMISSIIRFVSQNRSDSPGGNEKSPTWHGLMLVLIITITQIIWSIIINQFFHYAYCVGIQARTGVTNLVYKKAFKLSNKSLGESSVGEMVNIQAVDAYKLQELMPVVHSLWSSPLQIVLALILLYRALGVAAFAGLMIMIIIVPLNHKITQVMVWYQRQIMTLRDKRVQSTNEILNGIRIIKLFAWEFSFQARIFTEISIYDPYAPQERVQVFRASELELKTKFLPWLGLSAVMWIGSPIMVSFATFAVYTLLGNELTAERAFSGLALLALLRNPMGALPNVISSLLEARVSMDRIVKFLTSEEVDPRAVERYNDSQVMQNSIEISDGTWKTHFPRNWNVENLSPVLKNIDLQIPRGKLTAVVGTVGAGKSSLLSAILGNVPKIDGRVQVDVTENSMKTYMSEVYGSLAYVAQAAWIQNASLRDNILFGSKYEKEKYNRIIRVCELEKDLKILPDGDATEIGEKGINLSGGQKQRVALARAVYQDADVYLLDDPLSAVDAHVGKNIFDRCISREISLKTRVLVTHQIQHVSKADLIVVMKEGKISERGAYSDLMAARGEFYELITTHVHAEEEKEEKSDEKETINTIDKRKSREDEIRQSVEREEKEAQKLMTEESRAVGSVATTLWKFYIDSMGLLALPVGAFAFQSLEGLVRVGNDLWLSYWTAQVTAGSQQHSNQWFLNVFAVIGAACLALVMCRKVAFNYCALRATSTLHGRILNRVMRAPTEFFDTTPVGRILNVFARDISSLDDSLPPAVEGSLLTTIHNTLTMCIICYIVPLFLSVLLPLCYIYRYIAKFYLSSTRELKRLDSISKSPIYAQFSETLGGSATIRSFQREESFVEKNYEKTNDNNRAFFAFVTAGRWLGFRLDMMGVSVTTFAATFAILQRDHIDPGSVGLLLSYCFTVIGLLNMLVRNFTDAEAQMVSVERIHSYTLIDSEAPSTTPLKLPADWPSEGHICFYKVKARYREGLDLVLRGVSINIRPREKIGVVGRTGAGKSSLMLTLFRMIELSEGTITVDGVDISRLGLDVLRRKLAIIPQDPTLFSGTIRSNLDPFSEHTDAQIWQSLQDVRLKSIVEGFQGGIDFKITEGGENLSIGSRQLMCLARAILRNAKVLVMDEATAAVDFETDDLIQRTIRTSFKETTVLTIAHRIHTVMDYDKILVLDRGMVAEFDAPQKLLNDTGSIFHSMRLGRKPPHGTFTFDSEAETAVTTILKMTYSTDASSSRLQSPTYDGQVASPLLSKTDRVEMGLVVLHESDSGPPFYMWAPILISAMVVVTITVILGSLTPVYLPAIILGLIFSMMYTVQLRRDCSMENEISLGTSIIGVLSCIFYGVGLLVAGYFIWTLRYLGCSLETTQKLKADCKQNGNHKAHRLIIMNITAAVIYLIIFCFTHVMAVRYTRYKRVNKHMSYYAAEL